MANLEYNGSSIHQKGEYVCLSDMWKSQGSTERLKPVQWLNQQKASFLMFQLLHEYYPDQKVVLNNLLELKPDEGSKQSAFRTWGKEVKQVAINTGLIIVKSGKGGSTYAKIKLALAYAEDLSTSFHSWALGAIQERIEEEADPELGLTRSRKRAIKSWEKQGKSDDYIVARLKSVEKEDFYEAALASHGVDKPGDFGFCKLRGYQPILGIQKSDDFRERRGLKKKQNLKDGMTLEELAATDFQKILSAKQINSLNPQGKNACANISYKVGKDVAQVLNKYSD